MAVAAVVAAVLLSLSVPSEADDDWQEADDDNDVGITCTGCCYVTAGSGGQVDDGCGWDAENACGKISDCSQMATDQSFPK